MPYTVKQTNFVGPLDLLLELIEKRELSINEISLASVTDEFITHLKEIEKRKEIDGNGEEAMADQEMLAEFLVVAATLLLIKSRSLLPQFQPSPEEEESVAELERRLAEYQRLKSLAQGIAAMAKGGPKSFSREALAGTAPIFYPPNNFQAGFLALAFRGLLEAIPKIEKLAEEKLKRIISLEEKISELKSFLQEKVERAFSELISGAREKVDVIVSFLALLELAKQKLITVEQSRQFGDIRIRKIQ